MARMDVTKDNKIDLFFKFDFFLNLEIAFIMFLKFHYFLGKI